MLGLSLLGGCASQPLPLASAPVFGVCPAADHDAPPPSAAALPQPRCVEDTSIYSPLVWLPFFGPLYDAATNSHAERQLELSLLATVLPGIGPAIQTGLGARLCLAQCLPVASAANLPSGAEKRLLTLALDVSDSNCRQFLITLPTALGDDAAPELASGISRLLTDAITAERLSARQTLTNATADAASLSTKIAAYDALCSVDHSLAMLTEANRNQLSGNSSSKSGAAAAGAATKQMAAQKDGKHPSHINRINKSKSASTRALINDVLKNQAQRQSGVSPEQP
jgi:hypothetical protein